MFLCDIANVTVLAAIIHPAEGYVVTCPKIFIYSKPGTSELKFEHSAMQFGLASGVKLLKSQIWLVGEGKIDVPANEIISASGGKISL